MTKKRIILFFLILCLACAGCAGKHAPTEPVPVTTEAPTEAPTVPTEAPTQPPTEPVPEEPTEPEPVYEPDPDFLDGIGTYNLTGMVTAIDRYQLSEPNYTPYNRDPLEPRSEIETPRFVLCTDGIFRDLNAENDGIAVINLTGDLMCQTRQQRLSLANYGDYEFEENFYYIRDFLSDSDLTVGNLETMLCESASLMHEQIIVDEYPHCNAPSTFLDALRYAGFDMLITANNHNVDCGVTGIFETLGHLDQYGFAHTGLFRSEEEQRFQIFEIDGMKIAILAYSTKFNRNEPHLTGEGQSVLLNVYDSNRLRRDISEARALGAEFIIAYNHWGVEYTNEVKDYQIEWAQEMANCGVDYIIGSHPHALQRYDVLTTADGRQVPVVYSMGNFISHMDRTISMETIVLQLMLYRRPDGRVGVYSEGFLPCYVHPEYDGRTYTVLPVSAPYCSDDLTELFADAYTHIVEVIGTDIPVLGTMPGSAVSIIQPLLPGRN